MFFFHYKQFRNVYNNLIKINNNNNTYIYNICLGILCVCMMRRNESVTDHRLRTDGVLCNIMYTISGPNK